MVQLFLCLLLNASAKQKRWKGIVIERGQLITSYESLHNKTGLSIRTLRTCLSRLEDTGEIEREATNKFSIITISNYNSYQGENTESDKQTADQSQAQDNQEPPKPKKTKEQIKAETDKRMKEFYNSLVPYLSTYPKEMIRAFYDYWSETNKSGSKMRWEQSPTWVLEKRLQRWSQNNKQYNSKSNGTSSVNNRVSSAEERAKDAASVIASLAAEE